MPESGECKIERTLKLPFILVLDQIKDPRNLGTIIRTAAAVGCEKILITKGSVDLWDPKVIRGGMGGHFRVPIINNLNYDQIEAYLPSNTKLFFADSKKEIDSTNKNDYDSIEKLENCNYTKLNGIFNCNNNSESSSHATLVIGSEATGINKNLVNIGIKKLNNKNCFYLNIPLENGVESLNCSIAFAILSYEMRKILLNE